MRSSAGKMLLAGVLSAASCAVLAQTAPQDPPPAVVTPTGSSTQVESRLVSSFSGFAGSEDNARSLVTGLRQGSEITLTAPGGQPSGSTTTTGTTFVPPTRPMGYGNVRIALSLAQEQLAQSGVTQPTPEQVRTALMGGTITTTTSGAGGAAATTSTQFQGVLQMRADGMGWGQIANSMGVKLGAVMSGRTAQPAPAAPQAVVTGSTSASSGVTTAAGSTSATTQVRGRGHGASAQHNSRAGTGIVNATGGTGAGFAAGARAGGGAGVVTGANTTAGSRASAAGLANGKGHARP